MFPTTTTDFIEIGLIAAIVFGILWFLKGAVAGGVVRGLWLLLAVGVVGVLFVLGQYGLQTIEYVFRLIITFTVFWLVVIFQPELRRGLLRMGRTSIFGAFLSKESPTVGEICRAVKKLSRDKIGALIAVEREIGLGAFIEGGVHLDAEVKNELLDTIFWPGTALHDGAVIIQNDRIAAAACLFPLTDNPDVSKRLGTRHRSAIGLSEETDAVVVVVSEETGGISLATRGALHSSLDPETFEERLKAELSGVDGKPGGDR